MLSSQTKDPVNAAAMSRLIKHGMVYDVLGLLLVVLILDLLYRLYCRVDCGIDA